MANYRKYVHEDVDKLYQVVIKDVKPGWIDSSIEDDLKNRLSLLLSNVKHMNDGGNICPNPENILEPFKYMTPAEVRCVVLGQDPYPRLEDAVGIAFHANGHKTASLGNIKLNLINKHGKNAYAIQCSDDGWSLIPWLEQGVLLTNRTLTCKEGASNSHSQVWFGFINKLMDKVPSSAAIVLMGREAQNQKYIFKSKHVIMVCHPVERSGAFINLVNEPFIAVNKCIPGYIIDWAF